MRKISSYDFSKCLGFQIIKKTRFPHWGETLELDLHPEELSKEGTVTLEVWDWDMVGKNDFLGKVRTQTGSRCFTTAPQMLHIYYN